MQQHDLGQILDLKPKVATMPLSSIKLSLDDDQPICQINGLNAVLDKGARSNIIKMSGLDQKSIDTIKGTAGSRAANQILKTAMKALGNRNVTLAFDGPRITRVVDPGNKNVALRNHQVVQIAEMLVQKGMKVWGLQMNPDGTSANIQLVDPKANEHPTMKDESVSLGRSIHWDALGGTSINEFVQRLICSNGMTRNEDGAMLAVLRTDANPAEMLEKLFMEGAEKKLARHFERIQKLQEISLSVREWQQLIPWLSKFDKDTDVFKAHLGFKKLSDVPFEKEYEKRGFKLDELSQAKLANCPTPINWWDAINCMTWLGSHPNDSGVDDWTQGKLLNVAGRQMGKKAYDADQWLTGLPNFN